MSDDRGPAAPASLRSALLDSAPGSFSISVWQNIAIICWPAPATEEAVRRVDAATTKLLSSGPARISAIHIISESVGVPNDAARARLIQMADRYAENVACIGVAVLGTGFWASARQSAVTSMRMQRRGLALFKLANSLDAIAEWLSQEHFAHTAVSIYREELRDAMTRALEWTMHQAGH